jgi:hypothetical protein
MGGQNTAIILGEPPLGLPLPRRHTPADLAQKLLSRGPTAHTPWLRGRDRFHPLLFGPR